MAAVGADAAVARSNDPEPKLRQGDVSFLLPPARTARGFGATEQAGNLTLLSHADSGLEGPRLALRQRHQMWRVKTRRNHPLPDVGMIVANVFLRIQGNVVRRAGDRLAGGGGDGEQEPAAGAEEGLGLQRREAPVE